MTSGIPGFLARPLEGGPPALSVSELNRAAKGALEDALSGVWVQGEIDGWKVHRNGHRYFTLKDDAAAVSCVMWRSAAAQLPMDPENGMRVRVFGGATLWEGAGRFQFTVRRLEAAEGEGLWKLAFERLRERLGREGLLAPERKRSLPRFPGTVGVVTSISGAALRDILSVIRRRAPWTRVLVMDSRVQGEGAAEEIAAAVRALGSRADVDVLIVGRGGGSREDLWAFNEEPVARAIVECPVPVVSAVGHEVDVSISDLVADHRAPTPSAAAEAVVQDREALLQQLDTLRLRLRRGLQAAVDVRRRRIADAPRRLARGIQSRTRPMEERTLAARRRLVRAMETTVADRRRRADVLDRLRRALTRRIEGASANVAGVAGRLEALSPLSTLARGYAIPLGEGGKVMKSTRQFVPGAPFRLRVTDGAVGCRVESILEESEE